MNVMDEIRHVGLCIVGDLRWNVSPFFSLCLSFPWCDIPVSVNFWSGVHWFIGWSEVEVDFLFFLGFFLGWIKVYKKPSHSQMWSSCVAKVTATRITYIHTYIQNTSLLFSVSKQTKYMTSLFFDVYQTGGKLLVTLSVMESRGPILQYANFIFCPKSYNLLVNNDNDWFHGENA